MAVKIPHTIPTKVIKIDAVESFSSFSFLPVLFNDPVKFNMFLVSLPY